MAPSISFTFPETSPPSTSLAYLLDHHSTAPLSRTESDIANFYIDELESRIALLDEAIASLQLRRANLLQSVNTHKAILAPVRRLPSEILGEIFSLVVSATFQVRLPPTGKTLDAPWLFTRVCRRWSAVALATPALWSTVFLHLNCDRTQGTISLTKLCFQRSGNLPLTIHIVQESGTRDSRPLLDVALLSSERWEIADLYMAFPLFQQITRARSSFPSLTTLLICTELRNDWRSHETFLKTSAVAPKLKDAKAISWGEGGFMAVPFTLPWHQLTRVSATFASALEALPVLRKLSHIVECKFTFARSEALPIDYSTIRLPHLCSLALEIESDDPDDDPDMHEPNSLLDFLQTPCLRSLTTYETAEEEAVLGLITRSDCAASLASFHFHSISINQNMFLHLVQKMSHLTSLEFGDCNGTLLPGSSIPTFIQTLSQQWLRAAQDDHPRRTLNVRIADQELDPQDAENITFMLTPMHKDGLFITVSSILKVPDIISENFDY